MRRRLISLILIGLFLCGLSSTPKYVLAMCSQAGGYPLRSVKSIPALTNATVYSSFVCNDVTGATEQYLWELGAFSIPEYNMHIANSKLYFETIYSVLTGDSPDSWSCPISSGVEYTVGVKYNFNGSANTPTIYLNGVKQTLTKESNRSGTISAHNRDNITFGGYMNYSPTLGIYNVSRQFNGRIGEFMIIESQQADETMELNTKAQAIRQMYFNSSGVLIYCPLDEHGNATTPTDWVNDWSVQLADADISGSWDTKTQATYWQSINEDDLVDYIQTTGTDTLVLGFEDFTLPANATYYCITLRLHGYTSGNDRPTVRFNKGGVWQQGVPPPFVSGATPEYVETPLWQYYTEGGGDLGAGPWSQSDINGLQIEIKGPPTVTCRIYYAEARVYYSTKPLRDWTGNGRDFGSLRSAGRGEYKSYP